MRLTNTNKNVVVIHVKINKLYYKYEMEYLNIKLINEIM